MQISEVEKAIEGWICSRRQEI